MTRSTSPLSSLVMNSLKITSSSGSWCGTLNRLNNKIMKRPTTTQKRIFFVLAFIEISLWMARTRLEELSALLFTNYTFKRFAVTLSGTSLLLLSTPRGCKQNENSGCEIHLVFSSCIIWRHDCQDACLSCA